MAAGGRALGDGDESLRQPIGRLRRRVGMAAVQAMARHRLARMSYIDVPRAVVEARQRRGGAAAAYAPAIEHNEFYAFQAGAGGQAVAVA